jgi:cell division protease FtsH
MPEKPNRDPMPPMPPNRFSRTLMGWVVVIGLALLMFTFLSRGMENRTEITPGDFWTYVENGQVTGIIVISDREVTGTLSEDAPGLRKDQSHKFRVAYDYAAVGNFEQRLQAALSKHNSAKYRFELTGWFAGLFPQLLLTITVFVAVWFFLFRRLGAAAGGGGILGNFGRSRHRLATKEQSRITFNDVAGIDEAKDEVGEIIEFLKNPRKFQRLGGRVPRGVLLVGEPGCGKTLLAKAIAGEAEVPFFSISGSDFVEMFVGVGASRVRDLFKQAKDSSPCIVFLDEIDAVGRRRGMGFNGGGHDEREQTLNAILVEMDGFDSSDQVIVIAATNRSDVLDPALTRPGRFDRQITVPLPDLKGRYEILKIYAGKVKCGDDVDLLRIARGTPMFSGADLAALVNEAAIAATMADKDAIGHIDLEEARDKVRWGRARKSRVIDEKEKELTAFHEAGHAMVQAMTPGADPLHKVSIIPRGQMGGATFSLPEKDRHFYTRSYCLALLRVCLGGRVAEEVFCNDISSGASSDIANATDVARKMVLDWGMSEKLGPIRYFSEERRMFLPDMTSSDYSDRTAELIDQEVHGIIDEALSATRKLIEENRDKLDAIAKALLKYETLSGDEVRQIIEGKSIDRPTVGDLIDREHAKTPSSGPAATDAKPSADGRTIPEPG